MNELTTKQEKFVLNLFGGMYQRDAYIDAYKPAHCALSTIDANASRLANNDKVLRRLKELKEATAGATVSTVLERKEVLTEVIRGRFADFMTHLTAEKLKSAALQEIRITEFVGGPPGKDGAPRAKEKTTTIKLHNPVQAIAELNKMEKIYGEGSLVIDNRTLNIIVNSEKAKELTQKLIEGERTD